MWNRQSRLSLALAGLTGILGSTAATAADWSIQPMLQWRIDYDTNRRMAASGEQATTGAWLFVDSTFAYATETLETDFHPHFELQRFVGDSALDSQNGSILWNLQSHSELSSFAASAEYEQASTLTTELADTGIIDASSRRDTASGNIALGHDVSELQHLDLLGSYADVRYPNGLSAGLIGYRYPSVSVDDVFATSERTKLTLIAFTDRLTAPQVAYVSEDAGVRASLSHALSLRFNVSGSFGFSQTTVDRQKQLGYVGDLHITRTSELGQLDLSYTDNQQPSGRGFLVNRGDLALVVSQSFAPELYATLTVHDVRNRDLASGPFLDVPHFLSADAGVEWRSSPEWTIDLTAGMTQVRLPVTDALAHGWHAAFNTKWAPLAWHAAR